MTERPFRPLSSVVAQMMLSSCVDGITIGLLLMAILFIRAWVEQDPQLPQLLRPALISGGFVFVTSLVERVVRHNLR